MSKVTNILAVLLLVTVLICIILVGIVLYYHNEVAALEQQIEEIGKFYDFGWME